MMIGFDTAADCRPHIGLLEAKGYSFACRYYRRTLVGWGSITPVEAKELTGAGFWLVSVFQHTSNYNAYFTRANGTRDALAALLKAAQMAQPTDSAIYFAVDANPPPDHVDQTTDDLIQYFLAVNEIFKDKGYAVGVYGSGLVCDAIMQRDLAIHAWLTNAKGWFGTKDYKDWAIKQYLPITLTPGFDVDPDDAISPEVAGMWEAK